MTARYILIPLILFCSFHTRAQIGSTCSNPFIIDPTPELILDSLAIDATDGPDFYEFTVPQNGFISFSNCETGPGDNDDYIKVYEGSCANLIFEQVGDVSCVRNSKWESAVTAGTKYIFEWGVDFTAGTQTDQIFAPIFFYQQNYPGYSCASAETIYCLGEFDVEARRTFQWHKWIAPATSTFELGLPDNHTQIIDPFDGIPLQIEILRSCNTIDQLATNDPDDSFVFSETVTFNVIEGEDYYFTFQNYGYVTEGDDPLKIKIVELNVEPITEANIELKDTFGGMILSTTTTGESFQWLDSDTGLPILGAIYSNYKPIANGNYHVEVTSDNCILSSTPINVVLNNGNATTCEDAFTIDFDGESVLDTLIVDGSNGADFFEFTVPANGYMTLSTCRSNIALSNHNLKAYLDNCALIIADVSDICDGHFDFEIEVVAGQKYLLEIDINRNEPAENQIDQIFDVLFYYRENLQGFECEAAQTINCLGEFEIDLRGAEQWYTWVAPNAGEFVFTFAENQDEVLAAEFQLELYQGENCTDLNLLAQSTENQIIFFPNAGARYYYRVVDEFEPTPNGPYIGRFFEAAAPGNISTAEVIELAKCVDYFFDNVTLSVSGIYHGAFISQEGCDSLVTLNLTILESETNSVSLTEFSGYEFGGNSLTAAGTYSATFTNQLGCDSIVTLNLTLRDGIGWTAEGWSNIVGPSITDNVVITSDYSTAINGAFDLAGLEVENDVTLTVSPGTTLDVNGNINNLGNIIIESGASVLTYQNNYTGNDMTFIRNTRYSNGRYSMVGSPVFQNANITTALLGPTVYTYDETQPYNEGTEDGLSRWITSNTEVIESGKGYAAAGQETIIIKGVPTDGDVTLELDKTIDPTTSSINHGWHLVSNPYPAAININEFININTAIDGFVALWDDPGSNTQRGTNADYLIANTLGSVSGRNGGQFEGYIGSMQGFFIRIGAHPNIQLQFTMDMRVESNNSDDHFFRKAKQEKFQLWLSMSDESNYSETLIGFREDATIGLDRLYDAIKFKSNENHNLYSTIEELPHAIQGVPFKENLEIPLGLDRNEKGTVLFGITEKSNIPSHYKLELSDNSTGISHPIGIDNPISLEVDSGVNQSRFTLLVSEQYVIADLEKREQELKIYVNNQFINIENEKLNGNARIRLIDMSGNTWMAQKKQFISGQVLTIQKPKVSGIYLVHIELAQETIVQKLLIR